MENPIASSPRRFLRPTESEERAAAWTRGEVLARELPEGLPPRGIYSGIAHPEVAERAFAALADHVRDYAVFLLDADGIITFWGHGAHLMTGWSREQAEGAHLRLLYPEGGSEDGTAEEHMQAAAERGEYTGEGHRVVADGALFWAGLTLTAIRDMSGRLLGFVKLTRDLTAHRAGRAASEAALRSAEEASRLKSQFLATVSHEVRTPLTAIMAYTDLMKMELTAPLPGPHHQHLDKIRASSEHLLGLLNDILDVSRVEAGRMAVARSNVRVGRVTAHALALLQPQSARADVQVVDAVSEAAAAMRCWGDEERIRQILLNLLGNAVKFTAAGGTVTLSAGAGTEPPLEAEVERSADSWVWFSVEDDGPGIADDRLEHIFEDFVQVDMSATRRHGGTGLGLAISRRFARLMGGDVLVRSRFGVGSRFTLWLPFAAEEADAASPDGAEEPLSVQSATLASVREVIIGDLDRILHAYVARLRSDTAVPSAASETESEIEDHLATFLTDIAQTLSSMELSKGSDSGALRDGVAIQRTIAQRHGEQRWRLGWDESEIHREFEILREEIGAAIRRRTHSVGHEEVEQVVRLMNDFLDRAELTSTGAYLERKQ